MNTPTKKELEAALKNLVDKLTEVENNSEYKGIWTVAYVHGIQYAGPSYAEELSAARLVLKRLESSTTMASTAADNSK